MTVVAVSGYFDPLHVGHLEYLEMAKQLGDKLIVIVNSDKQAVLKKGKSFMNENDRAEIVAALKCVDEVFLSIDEDKSVCKSLEAIKPDIFANGGDRSLSEIPETAVMKKYNIKMVDGWEVKSDESNIYYLIKHFKFKNFLESQKFINKVGEIAESEGHHPDIWFGWGYAKIKIYTHAIKGLHESDFILAAKINKI